MVVGEDNMTLEKIKGGIFERCGDEMGIKTVKSEFHLLQADKGQPQARACSLCQHNKFIIYY